MTERIVTANIGLTPDGRYHGPGGPTDAAAIVRYATTDVARDHLTRLWETRQRRSSAAATPRDSSPTGRRSPRTTPPIRATAPTRSG